MGKSRPVGAFIPFRIDYKKDEKFITVKDQAINILKAAKVALAQGYSKVGVTYGANSGQTAQILKAYPSAYTNMGGSGQALVMAEMHSMLEKDNEYKALKGSIYILPITTIIRRDGLSDSPVTLSEQTQDQKFIEDFIKDGGVALGWQNQDTYYREQAPYPIAEGVARSLYTSEEQGPIEFFSPFQKKLISFAETYKDEALNAAIATSFVESPITTATVHNASFVPAAKTARVVPLQASSISPAAPKVSSSSMPITKTANMVSAVQSENKEKDNLLDAAILDKIRKIQFAVKDKVITLSVPPKDLERGKENLVNPVTVDVYEEKISEDKKKCGSFEIQRQKMITKDTDIQVVAAMINAFMTAKPGKRIIITPKDAQAHENFMAALDIVRPELEKNKADVIIKAVDGKEEYKISLNDKVPELSEQEVLEKFKKLVKDNSDKKISVEPKTEKEYSLYTKVFSQLLKDLREKDTRLSVPFEIKGVGSKKDSLHTPAAWLDKEEKRNQFKP